MLVVDDILEAVQSSLEPPKLSERMGVLKDHEKRKGMDAIPSATWIFQ